MTKKQTVQLFEDTIARIEREITIAQTSGNYALVMRFMKEMQSVRMQYRVYQESLV